MNTAIEITNSLLHVQIEVTPPPPRIRIPLFPTYNMLTICIKTMRLPKRNGIQKAEKPAGS